MRGDQDVRNMHFGSIVLIKLVRFHSTMNRRARVLVTIFSCATLFFPVISASASTPHKTKGCHSANGIKVTDTLVCKGLAYYKDKTLTLISPGQAGGTFDLPLRAAGPLMQQYLGAAAANVVNIPQGSTIPGQDQLAHAIPNGLTIGLLNTVNDVSLGLTDTPGLNFNPARLGYVAENAPSTEVLVVTKNSPITSFAQIKNSTSPISMLTETSGSANTVLRAWMGTLGVHPNYIAGYSTLALLVSGFVRGDGQAALINLTNVGLLLQSGVARAVAVTAIPPVGTAFRGLLLGLPTLANTMKQYASKNKKTQLAVDAVETLNALTGYPLATQTSVKPDELAALRAAATWAYTQEAFKSLLLTSGMNPTYIDPVKAKDSYLTALKTGPSIVCYIEGRC